MSDGPRTISIARDGAEPARRALERTIAGGGVAVFPADGLYGLACDPLSRMAIERLHEIKGRDEGKPSAVLFFSPLIMRELLASLGERTREALAALLPGPVTAVVHNPERRYPLACRADPERLGVRLIESPLGAVGTPLFQTSANLVGERAPAALDEVPERVRRAVDLAVDGGRLSGLPSTVIDVSGLERDGGWSILREGAMALDEVAERLAAV